MRVTLVRGDGIGPEVVEAALQVVAATGVEVEWEDVDPARAAGSARETGLVLKGPLEAPRDGSSPSPTLELRRALGLYVQVRPCRSLAGDGPDLVVIRETTEDLYAGVEYPAGLPETAELLGLLRSHGHVALSPGSAFTVRPISEEASRRALEFAFAYARSHGRRKVTVVHKATAVRATDGLFLAVARDVAAANPDVELADELLDNLVARLVRHPDEHDVLVCPYMYGDVVSDLAAALAGGVGIVPSASFGPGAALFEPLHGSAPRHAGADRANPTAAILSAALLLRHAGEEDAAGRIEAAVAAVVREGRTLTYDLASSSTEPAGTRRFADAVAERLAAA